MYNGLLSSSNGLLFNNFSIQRINKQVVITNVRLCMIVLSHISSNIWTQSMLISHPKAQLSIFCEQLCNCAQDCAWMDPFNVKGCYLVKNGLLINNFTLTNLLGCISFYSMYLTEWILGHLYCSQNNCLDMDTHLV